MKFIVEVSDSDWERMRHWTQWKGMPSIQIIEDAWEGERIVVAVIVSVVDSPEIEG